MAILVIQAGPVSPLHAMFPVALRPVAEMVLKQIEYSFKGNSTAVVIVPVVRLKLVGSAGLDSFY